jgi:hypothetical protein
MLAVVRRRCRQRRFRRQLAWPVRIPVLVAASVPAALVAGLRGAAIALTLAVVALVVAEYAGRRPVAGPRGWPPRPPGAGVREPRRPLPRPPAGAVALAVPRYDDDEAAALGSF